MQQPPFGMPPGAKRVPGVWEAKHCIACSDGDQNRWPSRPTYKDSDNRNYLIQLGQAWAEATNTTRPGVNFFLDGLPAGYKVFETPQPSGPQIYKRLFGHPSGRFYDSIQRFTPHFLWLMSNKAGTCECVFCSRDAPYKPIVPRPRIRDEPEDVEIRARRRQQISADMSSRSASANELVNERTRRNPATAKESFVDEEGTEDVWKQALRRLYKMSQGTSREIDIGEHDSIDWRATRKSLPRYLTQIDQQHSFIPRLGELVLWVPYLPEGYHILRDPRDGTYRYYSFQTKQFYSFPAWRAGIVAAVPSANVQNGALDFTDLTYTPNKKTSDNTAGFRIETMPDPNNDRDKSASKQYRYVPLASIRPLSQWQPILKGIPQKRLDESILYALTCMTSLSLVEKWRINGEWPTGQIFSKGLYLGSELLTIGDAVRFRKADLSSDEALSSQTPKKSEERCEDVLVIDSIRYHLLNSTPEHTTAESKVLASHTSVTLVGSAYTLNQRSAYDMPSENDIANSRQIALPSPLSPEEVKSIFRPVGSGLYGSWFHLHHPELRFEISYDQVLGRLYEADALRLWAGQRQEAATFEQHKHIKPDLNFDTKSIMSGRRYGTQMDERLPEAKKSDGIWWLMSDSRAQALSIASVNGHDVSAYHEIRTEPTLRAWRAHLKIIDGAPLTSEITQALAPGSLPTKEEQNISYEEFTSTTAYGGKPRGRKPGSKIVDGKVYTEQEFKELLKARALAEGRDTNTPSASAEHDEKESIVVVNTPRSQKSQKSMAMAATTGPDTDEEEEEDLEAFNEEEEVEEAPHPSTLLTVQDPDDFDELEEIDVVQWQRRSSAPAQPQRQVRTTNKPAPAPVLTKSQIMASTDVPNDAAFEDDIEPDSDEDILTEDWKDARYARGGTEEGSDGDYASD